MKNMTLLFVALICIALSPSESMGETTVVTSIGAGSGGSCSCADGITTGASENPTLSFQDSDCPGTDKDVGNIQMQYVDGADGSENADVVVSITQGGTESTEVLRFDESDDRWETSKGISATGPITGPAKVLSASASCTIGSDCDSTSVAIAYGGFILATAAITVTLPEIVASPSATQVGVGATVCVAARDASEELTIDVHANDSITLEGTKDTAGDSIDSTGAGNFACLMAVEADNWMVLWKVGTWAAN